MFLNMLGESSWLVLCISRIYQPILLALLLVHLLNSVNSALDPFLV